MKIALTILTATILLFSPLLFASTAIAATSSVSGKRICLDPGHGGNDPGAVAGGLIEKEQNLIIANHLKNLLEADEAVVKLTREDNNTTLGNSDRAVICNNFGADVEMSIHLNASSNPNVNYFVNFYGKPRKDKAFTQVIWDNWNLGNLKNLPTNFANGTILKTKMPATLVEAVFITNPNEQVLLQAGTRQPEIAQQLYNGLIDWFN